MPGQFSSIIILNWNGKEDTKQCLNSLAGLQYRNFEVVLLDNGSEDGSADELESFVHEKAFFFRVHIIKETVNLGFAGGNVRALRECKGEYIVLLNNDVVVHEQWLTALTEAAERDDRIFAVGGMMYKWNKDNPAFCKENEFWAYQRINPYTAYCYPVTMASPARFVDFVSGCALLLKKPLLHKVGFLETIFFAYYEETDLFARAVRKGFKIYYEPKAIVWHKMAASAGNQNYFTWYHLQRNRALFAVRNFDEPYFSIFKIRYIMQSLRALAEYLLRGGLQRKAMAMAFFWIMSNWRTLRKQRSEITREGRYNENLDLLKGPPRA